MYLTWLLHYVKYYVYNVRVLFRLAHFIWYPKLFYVKYVETIMNNTKW